VIPVILAILFLVAAVVLTVRVTIAKNARKAYQVWDDAENEKY
jgi:hypothetical protein